MKNNAVALLVALSLGGCGGKNGSDDASKPVVAAATSLAVGTAVASALAAAMAQQPTALAPSSELGLVFPVVSRAVEQFFPGATAETWPVASLSAQTGTTCSATCTYTCNPNCVADLAQVLSHCGFISDAIACPGGGNAQASGNIQFTVTCGPPPSVTYVGFQFSVIFSDCMVTLPNGAGTVKVNNGLHPLVVQGTANAGGRDVSASMTSSGLDVSGTLCGRPVNSSCRVNSSLTFGGSTTGSFCDCVLSNVASPNVCDSRCG